MSGVSIPATVRAKSGRASFIRKRLTSCWRVLYEMQTHELVEADCTVDLPEFDPDLPVEIRTAGLEDLGRLAEIAPPGKVRQFRCRLERGEICSIALRRERIASYVWVNPHDHFDRWFRITIPVDRASCIGYDAYTHPDFRHLGVRTLLHLDERRRVAALGRDRLVFWLESGVYGRATQGWEAMGLRQRRQIRRCERTY